MCNKFGSCDCQDNFFGDRCQHMCPWDNERQHCSGNGTCVYNPETQVTPYCVCNRWNTVNEDEEVAAEMTQTCADNNLFVWPNGWCSYYDASQGFDACYTLGTGLHSPTSQLNLSHF